MDPELNKRLVIRVPLSLWRNLELAAIDKGVPHRRKSEFVAQILADGLRAHGYSGNLAIVEQDHADAS